MAIYRLTPQAKADLYRIYKRGVLTFGEAQADEYYMDFITRFEQIAKQPLLYPAVDHIREGYRRTVCGVDSVYYCVLDDETVEIVTILGRQDEQGAFDDML